MYVLPLAAVPHATSRVIFMSYQLGDNATKTSSLSGPEQFELCLRILRGAAENSDRASPSPAKKKLALFADLLDRGRDSIEFVSWSQEKHFGGAFKMDRPMQVR
jgi:hypothetical protein